VRPHNALKYRPHPLGVFVGSSNLKGFATLRRRSEKMIDELVSVILPTYNRAYIISRAISSALNQTHNNFELIVVDDGSTDNTAEVVKSFNDSRIIYINHARNLGIASARNTGMVTSRGEYIAFIDSDDEWLPHKLREQLVAFEEASSNVGAIYTQMQNIEKGKITHIFSKTPPEGDIYRHVLNGLPVYLLTLLVKRKYLERTGMFDRDFVYAEDWDFCIRLSKVCNFNFVETPLAIRYVMSDSISICNPAAPGEFMKILNKHFDDIQEDRRMLAAYYFRLGYSLCLMNNLAEGRQYFVRAIKANAFNLKSFIGLIASFPGHDFYMGTITTYSQIMRRIKRSSRFL
jgi:glycosyltransferase involved in cell wall biosynthesis